VAGRRRPLAEAERRELDAALDADPTLRTAHDVGRAFDDMAFVRSGDEALIARVVDRTLGAASRRPVARWRLSTAVAAGFLLVASAAAGYRAGLSFPSVHRAPAAESHDVPPPAPRARARSGGARRPAEEPTAPVVPLAPESDPSATEPTAQASAPPRLDPEPALPPARAPRAPASVDGRSIARPAGLPNLPSLPSAGRAAPPPFSPAPSAAATDGNAAAADLFRRASAARGAGALKEACALYEDLEARFPTAEEARLSHVSLGKLLLAMDRPQEAERHFAIYLAGGGGGLAVEAAYGRAQSFERMGRSRDEREAWVGLLRDYPGSIYASAARRRIAALDASGNLR